MPGMNLKQRIHDGETLHGVIAPIHADKDLLKRILDQGPYDFVCTDSQHSALNEERLVAFCEMANEFGVPVQFRIKHTRQACLAGNYLDLGPSGIEIPQVELESTVDEAIEWFYYPPVGVRSFGGRARKNIGDFTERSDYIEYWNNFGVLWIQLESVSAVTNAHRLAKPGVDCLSFGPADLAIDIGVHPNPRFQSVDECVRNVVDQLAHTQVAVCYRIGKRENFEKYADMGVRVLLESPEL